MKTLVVLALLVAVATSLPAKPSKKTFPKKYDPAIHKISEDTYTAYIGDLVEELSPPEPIFYTHFNGPAVYPLLPPGSSYSEVIESEPTIFLQPPKETVVPQGEVAEESSYSSSVGVPSVELSPPGSSYSEGVDSQSATEELSPPGSSYSEGVDSQSTTVELSPPDSSYSETVDSQSATVELSPPDSSYSETVDSQSATVELSPPDSSYSEIGDAHGEHALLHLASMVRALPVNTDSSYVDYAPQAKGDPAVLDRITTALIPPAVDSYSFVPSQKSQELTPEEKEALEAAGISIPSSVLLPPPEQ